MQRLRHRAAMACLALALFLAGLLLGAVSTAPVAILGVFLIAGHLLVPGPVRLPSLSPVVWLVVLAFLAVIAVAALQILLTPIPSPEPATILGEPANRLAIPLQPRSINPARGIQAIGGLVLSLLAFLLALRLSSTAERARRLISALLLVAIAWTVVTLVQFIVEPTELLWSSKVAYRDSLTGPFVNRNTGAAYFGTALLCLIALHHQTLDAVSQYFWMSHLRTKTDHAWRALFTTLSGIALLLVALALTRSRAGILLSLLAATGLAISLIFGQAISALFRRKRAVMAWALAGVLAGIGILLAIAVDSVGERGTSDGGRLAVYGVSLDLAMKHPLWGVGLGGFPDAFPAVRPPTISTIGVWDRAHNTLIELAVEAGIPVTILVAFAGLATFVELMRGLLTRKRFRALPGLGAAICFLAGLHSMVDFTLQIPGYALFFFALLGATLAQARRDSTLNGAPA